MKALAGIKMSFELQRLVQKVQFSSPNECSYIQWLCYTYKQLEQHKFYKYSNLWNII